MVHYNVRKSSLVDICFIDASKAYDKVNHYKLFGKMLKSGVPFCHQIIYVMVFPTDFPC